MTNFSLIPHLFGFIWHLFAIFKKPNSDSRKCCSLYWVAWFSFLLSRKIVGAQTSGEKDVTHVLIFASMENVLMNGWLRHIWAWCTYMCVIQIGCGWFTQTFMSFHGTYLWDRGTEKALFFVFLHFLGVKIPYFSIYNYTYRIVKVSSPCPQEKYLEIDKCAGTFIPDPRVSKKFIIIIWR